MRIAQGATVLQVLLDSNVKSYNSKTLSVQKIATKEFMPPERPAPGGRVFTNLSNLSSGLRQFLYHNDYPEEKLYNIDIKNSQPFLINIMLRCSFPDDMPKDAESYIQHTSSGTFYEHVAMLMGTPLRTSCEYDNAIEAAQKARERKEFKQNFFSNIFFCKNLHTEGSKAWAVFQKEYPTVAAYIREAKKDDYKALSRQMQYAEAQVILEKVVRKLQKQKFWCASIHDSIVCLERDKQKVIEVMLEAFRDDYSLTPALNEEALSR